MLETASTSGGRARPEFAAANSVDAPALVTAAAPQVGTLRAIRSRGRARATVTLVGPAFVSAVAYVDPGNFATNLSAGAAGYSLVWVVVAANVMAMLVQYLSAKVGVVTSRDLPELCRQELPRGVTWSLWVQAELVAMATDLAEFVGAAIGLHLLFGTPLFVAGLITALVSFLVLSLQLRHQRRFEVVVAALLALVFLGLVYDLLFTSPDAGRLAEGLVPTLAGHDKAVVAAGIVGATVMPHVVYLHSALTKHRVSCDDDQERAQLLRYQRLDVAVGLGLAGVVNVGMLVLAACLFAGVSPSGDPIEATHLRLGETVGGVAALCFAVALLASGLSSASVGTYAGQVVMEGFLHRRVPVSLRRGLTMLPALAVLALGLPVTQTLVVSQVVLSFGIPFALVPLAVLTRRSDIMGSFANRRSTTCALWSVSAVIMALNGYLLGQLVVG